MSELPTLADFIRLAYVANLLGQPDIANFALHKIRKEYIESNTTKEGEV